MGGLAVHGVSRAIVIVLSRSVVTCARVSFIATDCWNAYRESLARVSGEALESRTFGELNEAERKPRPIQLTDAAGGAPSRRRRFPLLSRDLIADLAPYRPLSPARQH